MIESGVYPDLSEVDYFTATEWVSSSQLKRHLPEHFRPFSGSTSADFGSVFHERLSGGKTPVTVVDAATWQGAAAKKEREAILAAGGYGILAADVDTLDAMEKAVRAHSVAASLLIEGVGAWEVSVFAEIDGVPSKARFDRLLEDGTAVDVKTTKAGPGDYALTRAVLELGYDLQAAHYLEVGKAAGVPVERFLHVFVQNTAPFHVTVAELEPDFLERGRALRDLALSRFLHEGWVDPYPGASSTLSLSLPRWARL